MTHRAWLRLLAGCIVSVAAALCQAQTPAPHTPAGNDDYAMGDKPAAAGTLDAQPINVQTIFKLTNEDRTAQGLPALTWSPALAAAARMHGERMAAARSDELEHRYPGEADLATRAADAGAHFATIAENIAQGGDPQQIERAWMNSTPHRTNILDPRMNTIGIAVVPSGGTLYAVEDFADARADLSLEQIEQKIEAELIAVGAHLASEANVEGVAAKEKTDARANCPLASGSAPGSSAGLVLHWQGSDLALPPQLLDIVHSHRANDVAVGACPPVVQGAQSFKLYRVAITFY